MKRGQGGIDNEKLEAGDGAVNGRDPELRKKERSWTDYLWLWPILNSENERDGRLFSKREWIGWSIVVLVIVCAIVFT